MLTSHSLVRTPWQNRLLEEMAEAQSEILIVSPFIKDNIARMVWAATEGHKITVHTITRFKDNDFAAGASDLDAVWILSKDGGGSQFEVRYNNSLHAKIYILDRHIAYVGSSNLTFSGLSRNREANVASTDADFIEQVCNEVSELWAHASKLDEKDFTTMVARLQQRRVSVPREDEHIYTIHRKADVFDQPSERDQAWLDDAANIPRPSRVPERITSLARIKAQQAMERKPELEDQDVPDFERYRNQLKEMDERAANFLSTLQSSFGLDVNKNQKLYVEALCTPSAKSLRNNPDDQTPYQPNTLDLDVLKTWTPRLISVGRTVLSITCFYIALKSGILSRFGRAAVAELESASHRLGILPDAWDRNMLGPVIAADALDAVASRRAIENAAFGLFAATALTDGVDRSVALIEEYFNPLDELGSDVASIISLKDPKTLLQEITQQSGNLPNYKVERVGGSEHDPRFLCTIHVAKLSTKCEGPSKHDATRLAAEAMLNSMESSKRWRTEAQRAKWNALSKIRGDARHSVRPTRVLRSDEKQEFGRAAKQILGFDLDPDYLFLSLTDTELRRQRRLPSDNTSLAWLGAPMMGYAMYARWGAETHSQGVISKAFGALADKLRVDDLRTAAGMPKIEHGTRRDDIAQALIGALGISRGIDKSLEILTPFFESLGEIASQTALSRDAAPFKRLAQMSDAFDPPDGGYTTFLQVITQEIDRSLPHYRFVREGKHHEPTFHAFASAFGLEVRGSGNTKKKAQNVAAHELLLLIKSSAVFRKKMDDTNQKSEIGDKER